LPVFILPAMVNKTIYSPKKVSSCFKGKVDFLRNSSRKLHI